MKETFYCYFHYISIQVIQQQLSLANDVKQNNHNQDNNVYS